MARDPRPAGKPGRPPLEPGQVRRARTVSLRRRDEETIRLALAKRPDLRGRSAVIRLALDRLRKSLRLPG